MTTYINIQVNVDNDTFVDRLTDELCDVVDIPSIVSRVSDAGIGSSVNLHDSNGNTCGKAWISDKTEQMAVWADLRTEIKKLTATLRQLDRKTS